jgi:hypothetical protein
MQHLIGVRSIFTTLVAIGALCQGIQALLHLGTSRPRVDNLLSQQWQEQAERLAERHPLKNFSVSFIQSQRPLRVRHVTKSALLTIDASSSSKIKTRPQAKVRVALTAYIRRQRLIWHTQR